MTKPSKFICCDAMFLMPVLLACLFSPAVPANGQTGIKVKIWEEDLVLPTYQVDPPEKAPMFFNQESYQGASKVIYPYPLEDDMTNIKKNKTYRAVYIENEYLKVCVLPEIGGRLFYATDKTNDYEIFYRQNVIKPAHIGMLGAWISGGIEFCVFHHHRATTNMPVDYLLEENDDGSATVWIGETERRHRMKWTFGLSLHPGKSYLELDGRMINITENVNSILYWANVATHVNDDYQVIFPPSTQFAVYHAKNSFCHWPITREAYRGNVYYEGNIDASWWKNHPTANSFFAHDIKEGFLAGYDHAKDAGTMLVANPHIVKGAKLWEWGPGPRYAIWDTKVLTDDDGPYAELMSGAYSDNQPDYSWIKPYEQKVFKQYWYPLRGTGGAVAANLQAALNLQSLSDGKLKIAANTTSVRKNTKIVLTASNEILLEKIIDLSPSRPFSEIIEQNTEFVDTNLLLSLYDASGKLLIDYRPVQLDDTRPLPEPVKPPPPPFEIETVEELYLTGLRIKQFYNARTNAMDYFQEALRRDSLDTRCNTHVGLIYKEKGTYDIAAQHFRNALQRLTKDYTRPRNCEPFYHLGLILMKQGKWDAAYDTLYRAAWDYAFSSPAYLHLAQISIHRDDLDQALVELDRCLLNQATNVNALNLKASLFRRMGEKSKAHQVIQQVLAADPLNFWAYFELAMLDEIGGAEKDLRSLLRDDPESYLELAVGYFNAGLFEEAEKILQMAVSSGNDRLETYPTLQYYLAYLKSRLGSKEEAIEHWQIAQASSIDYCFPYRLESVQMYQTAIANDSSASRAYYFLGNLLYDRQPAEAIKAWEQAVKFEPNLAMAHRNLGWGYNQQKYGLEKAITAYENAIAADPKQPRFYDELDRLYEENGSPLSRRYEILTDNHQVVAQHNRPLVREAKVAIAMGKYDQALDILTSYYFNRREGSDDLRDHYVDACLLRGRKYLAEGNYEQALKDFQAADQYPENQSIGLDDKSQRRAQIFYLMGLAYEEMKEDRKSKEFFQKSIEIEVREPEYYYQKALAYRKLGLGAEADLLLKEMAGAADLLLNGTGDVDFFSKFGGSHYENKRKASGHYLEGLLQLASGNTTGAILQLKEALEKDPGHAWAQAVLGELLH